MKQNLLNTIFQLITIAVFLFIIFTPGVRMLCGPKIDFSYTEKRTLATFPPLPDNVSQIKKIFSDIDEYLKDHFGFREWMVYRYQREIKKRFPDVKRLSKVMKGLDDWYFFTENRILEDFSGKNLRNDNALNQWIEAYRVKKRWLENKGITYLLIVPPNKITVYGEFTGAPLINQRGMTRLSQIKHRLQESDSPTFLDLSPALIAQKNDENVFFKSDTHWTPYGAYLGYLAVADKIESLFPGSTFKRDFIFSKPLTRTCDKKENNCGDLTSMLLDFDSFDESYREAAHSSRCGKISPVDIKFSNLDYTNKEHSFSTSCPQGELKAVVFRDSFFSALVPFISANFKEVIYLWKSFDQQNIEEVLSAFKPDIVIEEIAERVL